LAKREFKTNIQVEGDSLGPRREPRCALVDGCHMVVALGKFNGKTIHTINKIDLSADKPVNHKYTLTDPITEKPFENLSDSYMIFKKDMMIALMCQKTDNSMKIGSINNLGVFKEMQLKEKLVYDENG